MSRPTPPPVAKTSTTGKSTPVTGTIMPDPDSSITTSLDTRISTSPLMNFKEREERRRKAIETIVDTAAAAADRKEFVDRDSLGRRKAYLYSDEQIMAALTLADGLVYNAARFLGTPPSTIFRRLNKNKKLRDHMAICKGLLLDEAESVLAREVRAGEQWAVMFFLRTQGKERGYVERIEQTGPNGGPIETKDATLDLTDDERAARLAAIFDRARTRRGKQAPQPAEVATDTGPTGDGL